MIFLLLALVCAPLFAFFWTVRHKWEICKSLSAGFWGAPKKSLLAGLGSGWEQQEDLAAQSAAATATDAREGTVLLWLCTLPWKQSWIFNGDVCMHVDVDPPSAVPVLAGYAALRPVCARGIHMEGPNGAGGYRREAQGGPERKGLRCSLAPGKQRTTSAEAVGTKGA